jgi:hypothetical protein
MKRNKHRRASGEEIGMATGATPQPELNAIVMLKEELSPRLMILRIAADGWELPTLSRVSLQPSGCRDRRRVAAFQNRRILSLTPTS